MFRSALAFVLLTFAGLATSLPAQQLEIPRRHDRPPGPPLSPEEAVAKMTVPEGFSVEIVAAEPDVVNPVAMCIDEKGRFWITESFEYPRKEAGPGRDRVKVLEDTDGDGKVDTTTVFAEGLNIPSGIAVGYGGVWVANSPDLLFMQDTDGDLKADKIETVVTGFGRDDTHELPNSLTWGPDGWLYGLNGVFNYSDVHYSPENPNFKEGQDGFEFTCAMFRIHPRTRKFEVFAEGTSNPWGIAINDEGDFFISACVIDHLWHIVETGYYIRQGGPYPPHTWPMRSIVDHKHQKAAYCGITWFDSDAYPEEYRNVLYMGNIHGGCINADIVERDGATYKGKPHPGFTAKPHAWKDDEYGTIRKAPASGGREPADNAQPTGAPKLADFLTANDAWFMPVVQKVGPDGCLYILDWYDRYHCYQDANADPAGIERSKGRLYRVRYQDNPHSKPFDLGEESDEELIERLKSANVYIRKTAQRLLSERATQPIKNRLDQLVRDSTEPIQTRLHALWALAGCGPLEDELLQQLIEDQNSPLQQWGVRLAGNKADVGVPVEFAVTMAAVEGTPPARIQAAIAIPKLTTTAKYTKVTGGKRINEIMGTLIDQGYEVGPRDEFAEHIAWENLRPLVESHPKDIVEFLSIYDETGLGRRGPLVSRILRVLIDVSDPTGESTHRLLTTLLAAKGIDRSVKQECLSTLAEYAREGALKPKQLENIAAAVKKSSSSTASDDGLSSAGTMILAMSGDASATQSLRKTFVNSDVRVDARIEALETLIASRDADVVTSAAEILRNANTSKEMRSRTIESLASANDRRIAGIIMGAFDQLEADVRPKAIELLTQRPEWSLELLKAIAAKQIPKEALNLNQLKRVSLFKNDELQKLVAESYGAVRQERRWDRQDVINGHRDFLEKTPGDPERGIAAFKKVCGQCHKMYGEGAEVGPDITRNGRNNWEQLLQNVFDPSAVIGPGYQARTLLTEDGRVLTGLPVEESDQRVVLKIQGGKLETIPRDQIDEYVVSEMSMMPEQLEKQLTPQEIADLFAYLALDKPPSDSTGKLLPGAPTPKSR